MTFSEDIAELINDYIYASDAHKAIILTMEEHSNMSPETRTRLNNMKIVRQMEAHQIRESLEDYFMLIPVTQVMEDIFE